jgi:hypothetical protein
MTSNQRGVVGGVEVLPFGLLIFVAGTLVILHAFSIVNAKLAVADAAREGARAAIDNVEADQAASVATAAARRAFGGSGLPQDQLFVTITGPPAGRCGLLAVTAAYRVPGIRVPVVSAFRHPTTVRSTYREHVERFGSGATGDATCGG